LIVTDDHHSTMSMRKQPIQTVGFIGTGIMGLPMAKHLAAAGFKVTAYNRSSSKAAVLTQYGVNVVESAAKAASGNDAVVVMLSSGPVCDDILFSKPNGAVWQMKPGSILIVMSSIPVGTAKAHAELAASAGIQYLDAPVSGGEVGAIAANLSIMVGGDNDTVASCQQLLQAMGRTIHIGPIGTGQLTKLANQLIVASTIVTVAESLLLAERGGAQIDKVRDALLGGFASSRILELHGKRMIDENFRPGGTATNQVKDTQAALELAESLELKLPMLSLTDALFRNLIDHGHGDLDHSALILELRRLNRL
jgi:2-hydroxy-3-oxopropionate reductase